MSFLGPIIWVLVRNELKDIGNRAAFKKQQKKNKQRHRGARRTEAIVKG